MTRKWFRWPRRAEWPARQGVFMADVMLPPDFRLPSLEPTTALVAAATAEPGPWIPGWRPSNGSEGRLFMHNWCDRCIHDEAARRGEPESGCPLILRTAQGERLTEWERRQTVGGWFEQRCTAYVEEAE